MKKRVELLGKKLHLGRETLGRLDFGKDNYPIIAGGAPGPSVPPMTGSGGAVCTQSPGCPETRGCV